MVSQLVVLDLVRSRPTLDRISHALFASDDMGTHHALNHIVDPVER